MSKASEIIIYIGTHRISAIEALIAESESRILNCVTHQDPDGFEKGFVKSLDKATASIERVLQELKPNHVLSDLSVTVVLGNSKLKTYSFSSSQYYQGMQRTISVNEIRAVVNQTRSVATLPLSEFVLQAIPESFIVNDLEGVINPLGLEAHRLGVSLKIFTMDFQEFKNISKSFEAADIQVNGYFPKTLSASAAVLKEEEKKEGALVFDIGDDITTLTLWREGVLTDTRVFELGSKVLTSAIAAEWGIEIFDARRVKEQYMSLESQLNYQDELIPLVERQGKGHYQIRRQEFQEKMTKVTEAWIKELLEQAEAFTQEKRFYYPHYVFTGGGTSIAGFLEFLQARFSKNGRMGYPRQMEMNQSLSVDPSASAPLGMVRWLADQAQEQKKLYEPKGFLEKTLASAKDWFLAYF